MAEDTQPSNNYKRPLWQWVVIYLVLAALVYGVVYYFVFNKKSGYSATPPGSPTVTTEVTSQPSSSSASPSNMSEVQVTVTGTEFAFNPSTITVKKGQTVHVTFKNDGKYPHNFTLSALGVKTATIQPGQQASVTFTANKKGSFTYVCTVPGHADRGMQGTLTVE